MARRSNSVTSSTSVDESNHSNNSIGNHHLYELSFEHAEASMIIHLVDDTPRLVRYNARAARLLKNKRFPSSLLVSNHSIIADNNSSNNHRGDDDSIPLGDVVSEFNSDDVINLLKKRGQPLYLTVDGATLRLSQYSWNNHAQMYLLRIKSSSAPSQQELEPITVNTGRKRTRDQSNDSSTTTSTSSTENAIGFVTPQAVRTVPLTSGTPTAPNTAIKHARTLFLSLERGDSVAADSLGRVLPALVAEGNYENVKFALESGANPNITPDGSSPFTALYAAVQLGNQRLVELLLEHGASVVLPNFRQPGETPLKLAFKLAPSPMYYIFMVHLSKIESVRQLALERQTAALNGNSDEAYTPYKQPIRR